MTSKERMICALRREKPDRLPVTVHQWQQYHLDTHMGGMDAISAFKSIGMDVAIQYFESMGQFWVPNAGQNVLQADQWRDEIVVVKADPDNKLLHHTVTTPEGSLTYKTGGNRATMWILEYMVKKHEDIYLIEKYLPVPKLNKVNISKMYDEIGDDGISRGFVWGDQGGCWQHACCLMDTQMLIMEAMDNPDWVHRFMNVLLEKKLRFIEESLKGAKFDLIETGGGAASDTVIGPAMYKEFCLPYDRQINRALHNIGHISTYHTCGGMVNMLDLIVANETDVSETLSPPGTGGNIEDPAKVCMVFGGKVAMIGGMDQFNVLTTGTKEQIRAEVLRLFQGFGTDGGYILSTSDHFFDTPIENLRVYAEAARECTY